MAPLAPSHMSGTDSEAYRLAILASERLRVSLARHRLDLPGIRGDHPSGAEPMVELGRASAAVVHAVADLLDRLPLDGREAATE